MGKLFTSAALAAGWLAVHLAAAQAPTVVVSSDLGRRVDEYLSRLEAFGFSGAVLVAKDGQVALSKGYGFANRGQKIP
ncbi:MAG: hypothetical protein IMZ44_12560, partial [Planctomycetes bacterium]|nr:hypothetical protein [Planctomycetota bacterium]